MPCIFCKMPYVFSGHGETENFNSPKACVMVHQYAHARCFIAPAAYVAQQKGQGVQDNR